MPTASSVLPLSTDTSGISDVLNITGASAVVAIVMPAAWTAAVVSIDGSPDGINFYEMRDGITGAPLNFNIKPGSIVSINPNRLRGCKAIRLRSGTPTNPVPQTATRVFGVVVESST